MHLSQYLLRYESIEVGGSILEILLWRENLLAISRAYKCIILSANGQILFLFSHTHAATVATQYYFPNLLQNISKSE